MLGPVHIVAEAPISMETWGRTHHWTGLVPTIGLPHVPIYLRHKVDGSGLNIRDAKGQNPVPRHALTCAPPAAPHSGLR